MVDPDSQSFSAKKMGNYSGSLPTTDEPVNSGGSLTTPDEPVNSGGSLPTTDEPVNSGESLPTTDELGNSGELSTSKEKIESHEGLSSVSGTHYVLLPSNDNPEKSDVPVISKDNPDNPEVLVTSKDNLNSALPVTSKVDPWNSVYPVTSRDDPGTSDLLMPSNDERPGKVGAVREHGLSNERAPVCVVREHGLRSKDDLELEEESISRLDQECGSKSPAHDDRDRISLAEQKSNEDSPRTEEHDDIPISAGKSAAELHDDTQPFFAKLHSQAQSSHFSSPGRRFSRPRADSGSSSGEDDYARWNTPLQQNTSPQQNTLLQQNTSPQQKPVVLPSDQLHNHPTPDTWTRADNNDNAKLRPPVAQPRSSSQHNFSDNMSSDRPRVSNTGRAQISSTAPAQISNTAPAQISNTAPAQISNTAPAQLSNTTPARISNTAPAQMSSTAPSQISNTAPSRISNTAPAQLSNTGPAQLSNTGPAQLSNTGPAQISNTGPAQFDVMSTYSDGSTWCDTDTVGSESTMADDQSSVMDIEDGTAVDTSVTIEGIPITAPFKHISKYFSTAKYSGGGRFNVVENRIHAGILVIRFGSVGAYEAVLAKPNHKLKNQALKVYATNSSQNECHLLARGQGGVRRTLHEETVEDTRGQTRHFTFDGKTSFSSVKIAGISAEMSTLLPYLQRHVDSSSIVDIECQRNSRTSIVTFSSRQCATDFATRDHSYLGRFVEVTHCAVPQAHQQSTIPYTGSSGSKPSHTVSAPRSPVLPNTGTLPMENTSQPQDHLSRSPHTHEAHIGADRAPHTREQGTGPSESRVQQLKGIEIKIPLSINMGVVGTIFRMYTENVIERKVDIKLKSADQDTRTCCFLLEETEVIQKLLDRDTFTVKRERLPLKASYRTVDEEAFVLVEGEDKDTFEYGGGVLEHIIEERMPFVFRHRVEYSILESSADTKTAILKFSSKKDAEAICEAVAEDEGLRWRPLQGYIPGSTLRRNPDYRTAGNTSTGGSNDNSALKITSVIVDDLSGCVTPETLGYWLMAAIRGSRTVFLWMNSEETTAGAIIIGQTGIDGEDDDLDNWSERHRVEELTLNAHVTNLPTSVRVTGIPVDRNNSKFLLQFFKKNTNLPGAAQLRYIKQSSSSGILDVGYTGVLLEMLNHQFELKSGGDRGGTVYLSVCPLFEDLDDELTERTSLSVDKQTPDEGDLRRRRPTQIVAVGISPRSNKSDLVRFFSNSTYTGCRPTANIVESRSFLDTRSMRFTLEYIEEIDTVQVFNKWVSEQLSLEPDSSVLSLRFRSPRGVESAVDCVLFFDCLPETTEDCLRYFLIAVLNSIERPGTRAEDSVSVENIIFTADESGALVMFSSAPVYELLYEYLSLCPMSANHHIEVEQVPPTTFILVSNLPQPIDERHLRRTLRSKLRVSIADVSPASQSDAIILELESYDDASHILGRKCYHYKDRELHFRPHYTQYNLAYFAQPKKSMSNGVPLSDLVPEPIYLDLIQSMPVHRQALDDVLQENLLLLEEEPLVLSGNAGVGVGSVQRPLVVKPKAASRDSAEYLDVKRAWSNLRVVLSSFFQSFTVSYTDYREGICCPIDELTVEFPSTLIDLQKKDEEMVRITVVGLTRDVEAICERMLTLSQSLEEEQDRDRLTKTSTTTLVNPLHVSYLKETGFVDSQNQKYPRLTIRIDQTAERQPDGEDDDDDDDDDDDYNGDDGFGGDSTSANSTWYVHLKGLPREIDAVTSTMTKLLLSLKHSSKKVEPLLAQMLRKDLILVLVHSSLRDRGIIACVSVIKQVKVKTMGKTKADADSALDETLRLITCSHMPIRDRESQDLARQTGFQTFVVEQQEALGDTFICELTPDFTSVQCAGESMKVNEAMEKMSDYILQHAVYQHTYTVDVSALSYVWEANGDQLHQFMEERSSQNVSLPRPGQSREERSLVVIKGTRDGAADAKRLLTRLFDDVKQVEFSLVKPGILKFFRDSKQQGFLKARGKELGVVVRLGRKSAQPLFMPVADQAGGRLVGSISSTSQSCVKVGNVTVEAIKGDMTKMACDVLVNAANGQLHHSGGLARAISVAAGPSVQAECTAHVTSNGSLHDGQIFVSMPGNLPCKKIAHAVGPQANRHGYDNSALRLAVMSCLKETDRRGFSSIIIPAISAGIFGVPMNESTDSVVETVVEFVRSHPESSVTRVVLANDQEDGYRSFIRSLRAVTSTNTEMETRSRTTPTSNTPHDPSHSRWQEGDSGIVFGGNPSVGPQQIPSLTTSGRNNPLSLFEGDITRIKCDLVVNSVQANFQLVNTGVCGAIYSVSQAKGFGDQMQKEITAGLPLAQQPFLVWTSPCGLPCQLICHVTLRGVKSWNTAAQQAVEQCVTGALELAARRSFRKVAIPALGTGQLKLPPDAVATTMCRAVTRFFQSQATTGNSYPSKVSLVVHPKDTATVQAFRRACSTGPSSNSIPSSLFAAKDPLASSTPPTGNGSQVTLGNGSHVTLGNGSQVTFGNVILQTMQGDLTDEGTVGIVNSTDSSLSLQGQVSRALAAKAGGGFITECNSLAGSMSQTGVVVTKGWDLKCTHVIHVAVPGRSAGRDQWKQVMDTILTAATKFKMTSVSIPALGTGGLNIPSDVMATWMLEILIKRISQKKVGPLRLIRVVCFESAVAASFMSKFQELTTAGSTTGQGQGGIFNRISRGIANIFQSGAEPTPLNAASAAFPSGATSPAPRITAEGNNVTFVVYTSDVTTAEEVKLEVAAEYDSNAKPRYKTWVSYDKLPKAKQTEMRQLFQTICSSLNVDMTFNEKTKLITFTGLADYTENAKERISGEIEEVKGQIEEKRDAERTQQLVKWTYQDPSSGAKNFNARTNQIIETLYNEYKAGSTTKVFSFHNEGDVKIMVDFSRMAMWDAGNQFNPTQIERADITASTNSSSQLSATAVSLPSTWTPPLDKVTTVPVTQGSRDYNDVVTQFMQSIGGRQTTIIQVERVQNPHLWKQYQAQKDLVSQKMGNPRRAFEQKLFHGSDEAGVTNIGGGHFSRSFSGSANAAAFGNGVYFARDSSYSARDQYSKLNQNGEKFIILADVLVGKYTQGARGMVTPPVNPATGQPFDCTVDNPQTPTVFVIYHDAQAYPLYIIKFK